MRLIDADALVELIKKEQSRFENAGYDEWCNGIYLGLDKAIDEIDDAPTVDAVPVVHGRWIWNEDCECWICSACEASALNDYRGNSTDSDCCPNCGAKMDLEVE